MIDYQPTEPRLPWPWWAWMICVACIVYTGAFLWSMLMVVNRHSRWDEAIIISYTVLGYGAAAFFNWRQSRKDKA